MPLLSIIRPNLNKVADYGTMEIQLGTLIYQPFCRNLLLLMSIGGARFAPLQKR